MSTKIQYSLSDARDLREVVAAEYAGFSAEVDAYIAQTDWDKIETVAGRYLDGPHGVGDDGTVEYDEYLDLRIHITR